MTLVSESQGQDMWPDIDSSKITERGFYFSLLEKPSVRLNTK